MILSVPKETSALIALIRRSGKISRAELLANLGLSRATLEKRLELLISRNLVASTRSLGSFGRPAELFQINAGAAYILAADIGGSHTRLGITDLAGKVLLETEADLEIARGPQQVMSWVSSGFSKLLSETGISATEVCAIGLGVPGPIDQSTGRLVRPPIMAGWDGYRPADHFSNWQSRVSVDRDSNLIALGEHRIGWAEFSHLAVLKVGIGLGVGFILDGQLYRGANGAAGDLGHLQRGGNDLCRCGNRGCLEASASGWAIRRELNKLGYRVETSADIVQLALEGNDDAVALIERAGRLIGESLADLVGLINPELILVGGNLADATEPLLRGMREVVTERSQPLSVGSLQILRSKLGASAGVIGAALLAQAAALNPESEPSQRGVSVGNS